MFPGSPNGSLCSRLQARTSPDACKSLPEAETYLKAGIRFARLDQVAQKMSDTEWARKMTAARVALLRRCKGESPDPRETA